MRAAIDTDGKVYIHEDIEKSVLNTAMHKQMRFELEQCIIGAVMLTNGMHKVKHLLTHEQFTNWKGASYRTMYASMEAMHGNEVIDIVTLTHYIQRNHNQYLGYEISNTTNRVATDANLQHWALALLQYDLQEKFCELLMELTGTTDNLTHKSALLECRDEVALYKTDLFEGIEATIRYMHGLGLDDEMMQQLIDFSRDIDQTIITMKRQQHYESMINVLCAHNTGAAGNNRLAITSLINMVKKITEGNHQLTALQLNNILKAEESL